jgi:hypothetical protein
VASYPAPTTRSRPGASETSSGAFWMVATLLLSLAVGVVGFFALMMWADARESRDAAAQPPLPPTPRPRAPVTITRPTTIPRCR